jgi:hypothetical protein
MIARLWRGRVPVARAEEYRIYQEEVGPPGYRVIVGVRGIYMLGREVDELYEIAMLTFWDSLGAIRAFAGDPIDRARYYDRDFDFLVDPPERVEHFDVLATANLVDRPNAPERVARLHRTRTSCADGRHATIQYDAPAFTTVSNRGAYLLRRDTGSGYEVATVELWDSVNAAGPLPATAEAFDVLVREVIAAPE